MFSTNYDYLKSYELHERQLSLGNEFYKNENNYSKLGGNYKDTLRNILLSLPFFRAI